MKTKEGFRLRELGGDYILIGESAELVNFNNLITFNEAAAYLWQQVEGKEFTPETLAALLMEEYDVDEATALADARNLADLWMREGVVAE